MLSFISLTRGQLGDPTPLSRSLESCLGPPDGLYELAVIDGSVYDLPAGFNFGASRACGGQLIFAHDDVSILAHAMEFLAALVRLSDPQTGFVGVAGSRSLSRGAGWWQQGPDCRGACYHPREGEGGRHLNVWPGPVGLFGRVAVLDGLFLACTRRTFDALGGFDEALGGFHFYDLDVTLRASLAGLRNYAEPLPLFHQSRGEVRGDWHTARRAFEAKHAGHLPYRLPAE